VVFEFYGYFSKHLAEIPRCFWKEKLSKQDLLQIRQKSTDIARFYESVLFYVFSNLFDNLLDISSRQ